MSFKVLSGPYLNNLTRTASAPSMSPAALTLFPSTNAHDNRSTLPAIFGTAQEDSTLTVDLNMVLGDFESTGDAATWTILGIGSIAATSGTVYSGSWSALLRPDVSAAEGTAYRDVTVRSGEELNFFAATLPSYESHIRIRNRQTGNWLSTGTNWSSSQVDVLYAAASTSWATVTLKFTVESLATCITDTVTLRIYLNAYSNNSYFDQVELWPSTNWCSIHGHNVPPFIVPKFEYNDDTTTSGWTTQSTMTLRRDKIGRASCRERV